MELRTYFLKGFIGDKVMEESPKCPIECLFWEWVYSYYPDNMISPVRFKTFCREYILFMISNKHFSESYIDWINKNKEKYEEIAIKTSSLKITSYDVKVYVEILLNSIKEHINCVFKSA